MTQQNGHSTQPIFRMREAAVPHTDDGLAPPVRSPRVAVVHDWLPVYAGAERVLEQILSVLPEADLFSLIDFLDREQRAFLDGKPVQTSFIQRLPFARSKYRYYLPLAPLAIEQFDLYDYDVVVSSSYVVAKGALTRADQLHVCYVHSPVRYGWDLHFQYLRQAGLTRGLRSMLARLILHYIRLFDASTANRVDVFVANSKTVARRIWKTYRRPCRVIYPPVDTETFALHPHKEDFFVTVSRLVPYKRVDLIVEAFSAMPDKELYVIGDGPEFKRIQRVAGPNVTMLGYQPFEALRHYLQRARAFVYAAEEDFGIVNVEAQACGTPVIAYGRGGVTETVQHGTTGVLFGEQSIEGVVEGVHAFEAIEDRIIPTLVRHHAEQFSADRFRHAFAELIDQEYARFVEADGFVGVDEVVA